ncbi:sodium channel protein Nach-like isoform X2 [Choristoneura fumiferana]|uniref:sodium channel protein Nach-like isoform X2 n=1 Tax=Choristoneura fumiferana TaxID=7141 RepID=UPI003D1571E6
MVLYRLESSSEIKAEKNTSNDNHWIDKPTKKGFFANKFTEFCNRTDLHGYKYIVMEDINTTERSCWALAVVISIGIAVYFVVTAYKWYARNPIVTVIESTHGAIWDVPFPAVTICDLNVISRKAAREFSNNVVTADEVFEYIRWAPLLHSTFRSNETHKEMLHTLQDVLELNHISMQDFFTKVSPGLSCSELVQRCMWKNTVYRCDLLFQQVFAQIKLCCAFNYFAVDTTLFNKNPAKDLVQFDAPRRVASCGYQTALTVLVNSNPSDYYSSTSATQGVLVYIDDAYNIPDSDSPVRMVNPSTEVLIALSPERTYATPGIKAFWPKKRECYYNDELKIGQFRQYSYHNCLAYRKVQIIRKTCDCIPFYFPVTEYHRSCNFKDMECIENVSRASKETVTIEVESGALVDCLPECEHYDYPLEVAVGMLAKHAKLSGFAFFKEVNLGNNSLLNVFFNDLVSTRYRRDVYLNWQNILASFGGLLSLMLGFTLISGFDLVIFFTFRMMYDALNSVFSSNDVKQNNQSKRRKVNKVYIQDRGSHSTDFISDKTRKLELELRYGKVKF